MRVPGWQALGFFWAAVVLASGSVVWRLHALGPPTAEAHAAAVQASAAPPGSTAIEAPSGGPAGRPAQEVGPGTAEPPPAEETSAAHVAASSGSGPAATPPLAPLPAAPAPPPLRPAGAASSTADKPIAPPDPALLEPGRDGMLPRVGTDGRTAIRAYGREFDRRDARSRIGVIVADIGLSAVQTEEAIRRLPGAVALAVSPYAARPAQAAERARERGMETLISIPLEPAGYPLNDPGDRALLTGHPLAENIARLDWSLARAQGYVGAIGAIGGMRGERFAALPDAIGPVQEALSRRGLLYIDPRPGAPAPARAWGRSVDVILDEPGGTRGEIDRRLAELERIARERGAALGLSGSASPVMVERVAAWAAGLEARGFVLAPVTAMIRRPEGIAADASPIRPASAP